MAVPRVIGTETEYGITIRNQPDFHPTFASALVINSYQGGRVRVRWSFDEESPERDARGISADDTGPAELDSGLINVVLSNGARLYVDHAHPEYSSPECADPRQAALYDKAGEKIVAQAVENAYQVLKPGEYLYVHKNNSDGKGNSYGYHENYLIDRELPFSDLIRYATTWLVTRQIFTGSGKIGSENERPPVQYQISQRADFFEEEVGLETTLKRPIINTRDEPHSDVSRYRRFHVIIGDANMSEIQTFVKLGTTALLLAAIEDRALPDDLALADPVSATWQLSHDISLELPLALADGSAATALELQIRYFEWLSEYAESTFPDPVWSDVISEWGAILHDLEQDVMLTADRIDWTAKLRMLSAFRRRDDLEWHDPKLALAALQYHDTDPRKGLAYRLEERGNLRRMFDDQELQLATTEPPPDTRAYFRGRCVKKYPDSLVAANWDSLVFDVGAETLKRVPMMEPLRGNHSLVGDLIDSSLDAARLLEALES
ncbi:MAG: proteasome accessory factor PafA2 [Acidimicrobiia bacterium]|nr:depupylase/deamidase Dop [bacterium]MDE0643897.1 depupylase/deamidase Dop [bacterium]MXZ06254.1 proteasome accessory factor PafA2 [Acidimicrobiia bacterium]MYD05062.1 proteasome accessory factor PafA2 [Acidimicrobiia bacterium]